MNYPDPGDLAALVAVAVAILGALSWLIKAQVNMSKEFQRNGGSSTKDALFRIERDLVQIRERLDTHIDHHNGRD
jgi:hypothetical protein